MKFWTQLQDKFKAFTETPDYKSLKIIIPIILVATVLVLYLAANPIAISIKYDESAYDNYTANRESGYSFHSTDSGKFYTTHDIHPFDVKVVYLFGGSEDLVEAFDNGNITIDDLDRLGFDYWFKSNDK